MRIAGELWLLALLAIGVIAWAVHRLRAIEDRLRRLNAAVFAATEPVQKHERCSPEGPPVALAKEMSLAPGEKSSKTERASLKGLANRGASPARPIGEPKARLEGAFRELRRKARARRTAPKVAKLREQYKHAGSPTDQTAVMDRQIAEPEALTPRARVLPRTVAPSPSLKDQASTVRSAEEVARLHGRVGEQDRRIRDLEASLAAERAKPSAASLRLTGRTRAELKELSATLSVFAPTIELVRESAQFITNQVTDRTSLYKCLRTIEETPGAIKPNRVKAVEGWKEVHFSTGKSDDGRIYFKKLEINGHHRYEVLVSDKGAQSLDIVWMSRA